jgi:hypothetical protein
VGNFQKLAGPDFLCANHSGGSSDFVFIFMALHSFFFGGKRRKPMVRLFFP